ncbi:hypothetical protein B0H34DRAFT_539588 [Crassisporium funariophilum]|nr:hypothetical protein B0H34DRAFT_539588 [Crassisporium funariophilum]
MSPTTALPCHHTCPKTTYRRPPIAIALRRQPGGFFSTASCSPDRPSLATLHAPRRCIDVRRSLLHHGGTMSCKWSKHPDHGPPFHHTCPKTTYRRPVRAIAPRRHWRGRGLSGSCLPSYMAQDQV